ncbi:hypothetical protein F53441_4225 [Fusarium austroafricanum]|uniref:Uncharacterized protein n=1 Tax=Fusarium austroafricanum TaxID=2364996 RepID=A0A8H4KP64_9HYPO|nr:hypothetical protein F53441_4225 [Fusarium austroafricanum]
MPVYYMGRFESGQLSIEAVRRLRGEENILNLDDLAMDNPVKTVVCRRGGSNPEINFLAHIASPEFKNYFNEIIDSVPINTLVSADNEMATFCELNGIGVPSFLTDLLPRTLRYCWAPGSWD